jgi:hypothetical protein
VTVPDGPAAGEINALPGLADKEIVGAAAFLRLTYLPNKIILQFLEDGNP